MDVLQRLEADILVILCKLEKIFPPAFFDVMVHLAVHLPEEAMLRGPVQHGWMFPVERRLLTCKRYVQNTSRPEGSIAEAYVIDECLTFCSRYFDDVETRWNRPGRIESGMIRQLVMYLFLTMVCTFSEGHSTWRLVMTMRRWFGMCSEVALRFSHISSTSTLVCIFLRLEETLFFMSDV
jgi:hypothetical protein